jgi:hypothetical protein
MRAVLGLLGGLVAGAVAMGVFALIGGLLYPSDIAINPSRPQEIIEAFGGLPMGAKIAMILSWFAGALIGAAVAKLIVRQGWAAWTITALFALYVLVTVLILPMPGWMQTAAIVAPLIGGLIANHLVKGAPRAADIEAAPPEA